jgi:ABC-type Co2+ transport system permease subunit
LSYPAIINKLFQPPSTGHVAQRLAIWNKGYEAGKASIPLTAIGAAVSYLVGAYKFPLVGKSSQQAAIGAGVLHLGIIPFTVSFAPGCVYLIAIPDRLNPTI